MTKSKRGRPAGDFNGKDFTSLGGFIGIHRANKGLSLAEVSSQLGVSIQFLSNIEHGRAPLPPKYVSKLARVLRIPVTTLAVLALAKTKVYQDLMRLS